MADPSPPDDHAGRDPRRLMIGGVIAAVVLTVAVLVAALVLAARVQSESTSPDTGPLAVPAVPAPGADGRFCRDLMPDLPDRLTGRARRDVTGTPPGVAAWGDPAVILRCGIPDPQELTCSSPLTQFSSPTGASVAWLRLSDSSAVTYLAVDRPVRIAVTLPPKTGFGPVQQLTEVIGAALPVRAVCTNGTLTAPDNG